MLQARGQADGAWGGPSHALELCPSGPRLRWPLCLPLCLPHRSRPHLRRPSACPSPHGPHLNPRPLVLVRARNRQAARRGQAEGTRGGKRRGRGGEGEGAEAAVNGGRENAQKLPKMTKNDEKRTKTTKFRGATSSNLVVLSSGPPSGGQNLQSRLGGACLVVH